MKDVSYALGLSMAGNFKRNGGLDNIDLDEFANGFKAGFGTGTPKMTPNEARGIIDNFFNKLQSEADAANKEAGKIYLEQNKKREGVFTTDSGLQYEIIKEGNGAKPKATDTVRCHYEGRFLNGEIFDSSYQRNAPADFPVNGVIPGWVEALQLMPVGSKWKLHIPSDLAYGEAGAGSAIGPNQTLIFDVELLDIVK